MGEKCGLSGIILKGLNGTYSVETAEGTVLCRSAGRLRKDGIAPLAGDRSEIELNDDGTGVIVGIAERRNKLVRPAIANVDLLCVVVAAAEPEPLLYNIDKIIASAALADIDSCVVINKSDIASPDMLSEVYRRCGFAVFEISAKTGAGIDSVREFLEEKITVFAGASGVGKSSALNAMYPGFHADTGALSRKTERGKNTTRHTELYKTGDKSYIADTPGFSKLYVGKAAEYEAELRNEGSFILEVSKEDLIYAFREMVPFSTECRYRDCSHVKEEGCAVIESVKRGVVPLSRHESYVKMYDEISAKTKRT